MGARPEKNRGRRIALKDWVGRTFGSLTVVAYDGRRGGKHYWRCLCDCGKETVVITKRLRDGHRTSCGCDKAHFGESPSAVGRASLTYVDGTCVEMLRAKTVRCNNTSGVPGVDWLAKKQRWRASICFKGKRYYLGSYIHFEDAVRARKAGEENLHDRFLREFSGEARTAL